MQNLCTIHIRIFMPTIIIMGFCTLLERRWCQKMSRAGDCPADREEIWALHLACDGEYKTETLVEGTATCPPLQFGG